MIAADRPYPDELLSSALLRCCRWFNLGAHQLAVRVLGISKLNLSFTCTSQLSAYAQLFRVSAEDLLWNHTNFPYASTFVRKESFQLALKGALESLSLQTSKSVMRNASRSGDFRRVCLECMQEDLALHGESYWHRSHNLPGVLICVRHGCALRLTAHRVRALKAVCELPIECKLSPSGGAAFSAPALTEVAERSVALLHRVRDVQQERDVQFYRQLAISQGWLSDGCKLIDPAALSDCITRSFSADFLRATGIPIEGRIPWPALGFHRGQRMAPLKHLVLETALSRAHPSKAGAFDCSRRPPKRLAKSASTLDRHLSAQADVELARVLEEGVQITVDDFLRRFGARYAYTQRGDELPLLREAIRRFRASSAARRQLPPTLDWNFGPPDSNR